MFGDAIVVTMIRLDYLAGMKSKFVFYKNVPYFHKSILSGLLKSSTTNLLKRRREF